MGRGVVRGVVRAVGTVMRAGGFVLWAVDGDVGWWLWFWRWAADGLRVCKCS